VIGVGLDLPGEPQHRRDWVVASLRLRPGHSDGQLLDVQSRLVGINTMITGPSTGLAVPADVAKAFLREAVGALKVGV